VSPTPPYGTGAGPAQGAVAELDRMCDALVRALEEDYWRRQERAWSTLRRGNVTVTGLGTFGKTGGNCERG